MTRKDENGSSSEPSSSGAAPLQVEDTPSSPTSAETLLAPKPPSHPTTTLTTTTTSIPPPPLPLNNSLSITTSDLAPTPSPSTPPSESPTKLSSFAEPAASSSSTALNSSVPQTPKTPKHTHFEDLPRPESSAAPLSRSPSRGAGSNSKRPQSHPTSRRNSSQLLPHSTPSKAQATLLQTANDLRVLLKTFLVFVPSSLRRLKYLVPDPILRLGRAVVNRLAMALHRRGALATSLFYDMLVLVWRTIINLFFREIRSRGAWKVPQEGEGAVIFVVGPHHNQFLDPLLLMSEVRREAGRRISFLVAAKSMDRKFIGQAAKLMQSIPVARAQDLAASGKGTITLSPDDPLIVIGNGTEFKAQIGTRNQIMLSKAFGNSTVEVAEVLNENKLKLKKEFSKKAQEQLSQKLEGVTYKILPYVDQSQMYKAVYQKLQDGGCIGIFPEGGSHDRTDLLPLKAGVSIMALGALSANPSLRLRIVPVGLSYFHPHRFRSRAVVEFGSPIEVSPEYVADFEKGGVEKKVAIGAMMDLVVDGLKSVTVRAPDYETLMLIQATRRLYRPPGQHLTLGQIVELNKRFIAGYEAYKEKPELKELSQRVKEYNTLLRYMGLKDHQIERVARPLWRSIILLCYRIGLFAVWGTLALPGVILNSPIFIAATFISRIKAKEALAASTVKIKGNDVLATWKVLVALAGAPALYSIYAVGATVLAFRYDLPPKHKLWAPIATYAGLPFIGYSALKFGEVGMDVYKSLRPLFLSVLPGNVKQLDKLRTMRASLQHDISVVVNRLGPELFEDFERTRIVPPTALPPPSSPTLKRRSTYGPQGAGTFLTHPMTWVDEYLFGWSSNPTNKSNSAHDSDGATSEGGNLHSGYVSGYTTDEAPDYDEVIHILSREQNGTDTPFDKAASEAGSTTRYRRSSRSRSRSQLDLTALDAAVTKAGGKSNLGMASGVEDKSALSRRAPAVGDDDKED